MSSRNRRLPTLGIETLERRDLLTVAAELVSDFDFSNVGSRNSPIDIVAAGDSTYQVVWQKDEYGVDYTAVGRIDVDVPHFVRIEGRVRLTPFNDRLSFKADDERWVTDGTAAGTQIVKDTSRDSIGDFGFDGAYVEFDGARFFTKHLKVAEPGALRPKFVVKETELWQSDGTSEGTQLVTTIPGEARIVATTESHIFFDDRDGSKPLWVSDGTGVGTHRLANSGDADNFTVADNRLFYASYGRNELWVSDGTNNGTRLVMETRLDNPFGCGFSIFSAGEEVYFSAIDRSGNDGLWKTDGTEAGTTLVKDGQFVPIVAAGDMVYLAGYEEATGLELWRTDGTPDGTLQVLDLNPGPESSLNSLWLEGVADNGTLYFTADDGLHGFDVWRIPIETPRYVDRPVGDSNNDGTFDSSDLVKVFQAGKYENDIALATFEEGDWNGDGMFDSSDLVSAFQAGTYVAGMNSNDVAIAVDAIFTDEESKELEPQ